MLFPTNNQSKNEKNKTILLPICILKIGLNAEALAELGTSGVRARLCADAKLLDQLSVEVKARLNIVTGKLIQLSFMLFFYLFE